MLSSSNKGITLIVLVITIIVLLIISGTAIYVGYDTIQNTAEQRFLNQLKIVNEAVNSHVNDYKNLELTQLENAEQFEGISYSYKLETKEDYEKIGIYDVSDIIYVNFDIGQIYSKNGINGKHTLKDFGFEYYIPTQEENKIQETISFNIELQPQKYSWKYVINDNEINCNGNPADGNLLYAEYSEDGNFEWKRVERKQNSFELEIKQPGIYELKYRDSVGNESEVKQIYAYVKDGMQLYYDAEYNENYNYNSSATVWSDLSGNNNNGIMTGFNNDENSGWNSENKYLKFDGIDDSVLTTNEIDYEGSKAITIQFLDYNGILQNDETTILFESSENYNSVAGGFYINNLEYSEKEDLVFATNIDGLNLKKGINILSNINSYTVTCNTQNEYDKFTNFYKGKERLEGEIIAEEYTNDLSNKSFENYKLYIASRNCSEFFSKLNLGSVRIYNRELTEDEIAKNYEIDKIRFNIE